MLLLRAPTAPQVEGCGGPRNCEISGDAGHSCHGALAQLRQRLYGLALSYEDFNDHCELRHDLALQTAADRVTPLASAPILCRSSEPLIPIS